MFLLALLACAPPVSDTAADLDTAAPRLPEPTGWSDATARARLVFLSPDAGAPCDGGGSCVDVVLNDAPIAAVAAFPYGASTGFVPFPRGDAQIALYPSGAREQPVHVADLAGLEVDAPRTVVVHGLAQAGTLSHTVLDDDLAEPERGSVRIRVHHLVYGHEDAVVSVEEDRQVLAELSYGTSEILERPRGAHDWRVVVGDGPGLSILWSDDLDGDSSTTDNVLDAFVVPAPGATAPMLLVHSERTQAPGVFPR